MSIQLAVTQVIKPLSYLLLTSTILVTLQACSSKDISGTGTGNSTSVIKKSPQPVLVGNSGQRILSVGNNMAVETKEIIQGSCWDYINTVYNRAGYPQKKRTTVHKGKKSIGPYANINNIEAGDWLYYINHSYHGVEHSGIFINWVDKSKKIANILSYGGEHRKKPGRYRNYDLSNVYMIIRADS